MVFGTAVTGLGRAYLTDFRGIASKLKEAVRPSMPLWRPFSVRRPLLNAVVWAGPAARLYMVVGPVVFVAGFVMTVVALG